MTISTWLVLVAWVVVVAIVIRKVFTRRGRSSIGTGAAGAYYDLLSKDQREAVHIIVEKRAEKQDPETKDETKIPKSSNLKS